MARTAPVPNIPAPPGMNPGAFVAGGGGDGGGKGGKGGKSGNGKEGAGTGDGDADGTGDGNTGGEGCGDPVCPITGKVFLDFFDFGFSGPRPFTWARHYNSRGADRAGDLGFGWSHPYGWSVELRRRRAVVRDDKGREQLFARPLDNGSPVRNSFNWSLRLEVTGDLSLRVNDEVYLFRAMVKPDWFLLVEIRDRNHNKVVIERDPQTGQIQGLVDSAERPYRVENDQAGRIIGISVASEPTHSQWLQVARYSYDERGNLISFTDAESFVWAYRYVGHLLVEHELPTGLTYCYRYDGQTNEARCLETWGEYVGQPDPALKTPLPVRPAQGADRRSVKGINSVRFTYAPEDNYSEAENGLGGIDRYFGDAQGRVIRHINAAGGVTEKFFDPLTGEMVSETYPDGSGVKANLDTDGAPTQLTSPQGTEVFIFHAPDGTVVYFDEAQSIVVRRTYDARRNLTDVEHSDGTTEHYDLDTRGLVVAVVGRNGARTAIQHDQMGNEVRATYADGAVESSEYDYLGRRVAHVDRDGARTEWAYDRRSECVLKRHADGSEIRIQRNALRKPILIDDAGQRTRFEYGGLDWLTKVLHPSGAVSEMRYDVEGNLLSFRNARGQEFRQWFDSAKRCVRCVDFEGVERQAGFDSVNRPIWLTSPDGRETREYEPSGELAGAECADGEVITLARHPDGTVVISTPTVAIEQQYDPMGQIVRDQQGAHESFIDWQGGAVVNVSSDVGLPLNYQRSAAGDVASVEIGSTRIEIDQAIQGDAVTTFGTSLVLRRRYSPSGLLLRQTLSRYDLRVPIEIAGTDQDPGVILWRQYEYDAARTLTAEFRSDETRHEYELDAGKRVTRRTITRAGIKLGEETYQYDLAGGVRIPGASYDALFRPIAYRGETFEYDACGRLSRRMTDAGEWRYEWSAAGSLVKVFAPQHTVELDYDATGRLIAKRVIRHQELVSSVSYLWSNHVILHECDDLSGVTRTYVRDDRVWEPLAHIDVAAGEERAYLYVNDSAGAVDSVYDRDGQAVFEGQRSLFGVYTPTVDSVAVRSRFANQYYDPDVELSYNLRRWYEPRLGVFISTDPLLLEGSAEPRAYSPNPMNYIDPTGLMARRVSSRERSPANGHARRPGRPGSADFDRNSDYLLGPGHWATEGGPNRSGTFVPGYATATGDLQTQQGNWPAPIQSAVDAAGRTHGCHSCGTTSPGTKSGHFIPDHQPQVNQVKAAGRRNRKVAQVRLYPHCLKCSHAQKSQASHHSQTNTDIQRANAAQAASKRNRTHRPRRT